MMWQGYDWVWFMMCLGLIAVFGLIAWSMVDLVRERHDEHCDPTQGSRRDRVGHGRAPHRA